MNITFSDKNLKKMVHDERKMLRELGKIRAAKLVQRLTQLHIAQTLEDVRHLPGTFHELIGDRKGQWACDLDQPYRLILTPHEDPIPVNRHGQYNWKEIQGIDVMEIINYHKQQT